ncbi:MAG: lysylphosphatidylglycerol synthase transmembrane domain-containing protein [Gemmatimonadales bacterium]|nr:lysylphosphatidylglycerol synthase transmembrane domain-containing protein [Gemmatimonadales bacterium]
MSRKLQATLLLLGGGLFAWMIWRIGPGQLWANAERTGWFFLPIVLSYFFVYALNAWSWQLMMAEEASRPGYWRTFSITASAFALNYLTPMVQAGGEPYKVAAVAPWLGTQRAVGSVVLWRMLHSLSYLIAWFVAAVLGFFVLPLEPKVVVGLGLGVLGVGGLILGLLFLHREGVMERLLDVLHRVPLLDRVARLIEPRREALVAMDRQIADFYHRAPRRFAAALAIECLARAVFAAEFWLICYSVGVRLDALQSFVLPGLSSLIQNALFIIPYQLGTNEGAGFVLFQLVGFEPSLGVYTAIVSRLRDLSWIGLGLLLLGMGGTARAGRPLTSAAAPADTPEEPRQEA